jgi:methanogenic corrinoid protein MtbC1
MVGGSAVSEEYAMEIGADAYGKDAVDAVKKAKALLKKHLEK